MNKNFYLAVLGLFCSMLQAQVKEKEIDVQEVTIIKSYTPSLKEVFKIRENPPELDSIISAKKEVDYAIFSVPVVSTFVPSKGVARKLVPKKSTPQFNSSALIGFGNFNQLLVDYATNYNIDRRQKIDWLIYYNGWLKRVPDTQLDSKQANLMFNLAHQYATNKRNNYSQINFRQHQQSFYGLREPITDTFVRENIDPKQALNYLSVTTQWQWYDPWVKNLAMNTYITTDAFSTAEAEVDLSSKIQTMLGGIAVTLLPEFTYLTTSFNEDFYTRNENEYISGKGSLNLFASKISGSFRFKAGAKAVIGIGDEFVDQALFIYPRLALSYQPLKGNFAPFLNIDGDLSMNSFRSLTHENPYLAPAIRLNTSSTPYRVQLGTRSKFFTGWEFEWNLLMEQNDQQPLFRSLTSDLDRSDVVGYRYANAYEVIYTSITKTGVQTKLSAAFKNGGRLSFKASYSDFSFNNEEENTLLYDKTALNIPELSLLFSGTVKLSPKMQLQWYVNHIGERKNAYRDSFLVQDLQDAPVLLEDLPAFTQMDINFHYQLNERWGVYLNGKNLLNESMYRWSKYPVYGTQLLLGLRYNFDLSF